MEIQQQQLLEKLDTFREKQRNLEEICSWQWSRIGLLSHNVAGQPTQQAHAQALASLATSRAEVARLQAAFGTKTREFENAMEVMRCHAVNAEEARATLMRTLSTLYAEIVDMQRRQDAVEQALSTREGNVAIREGDVSWREDAVTHREAALETKEQEVNSMRDELMENASVMFYECIVEGWTLYSEEGAKKIDRCITWFKKAALLKHIKPTDAAAAWASIGYMLPLKPKRCTTTAAAALVGGSSTPDVPKSTVDIEGTHYDQLQCYIKSLELDPKNNAAWHNIAAYYFEKQQPTVKVGDIEYTISQLLCKALESTEDIASSWAALGVTLESDDEDEEVEITDASQPAISPPLHHNRRHKKHANVNGQEYSQQECYLRALELDPSDSSTWYYLGKSLTLNPETTSSTTLLSPPSSSQQRQHAVCVKDTEYTKQQCYVQALELASREKSTASDKFNGEEGDPTTAYAWYELYVLLHHLPASTTPPTTTTSTGVNDNVEKTITIEGVAYTAMQCLLGALSLDSTLEFAWEGLATMLAETPSVHPTPAADSNKAPSTVSLETQEGNTLEGMTARDCFCKVLEINPNNALAWYNLGNTLVVTGTATTTTDSNKTGGGGGTAVVGEVKVGASYYNKQQCYIKAVELNHTNVSAWYNVGVSLAATPHTISSCSSATVEIGGETFTTIQCFVRALSEITVEDSTGMCFAIVWHNLGTAMQKQQKQTNTKDSDIAIGVEDDGGSDEVVFIRGVSFTAQQCWDRALEMDPILERRFLKKD